MPPLASAHFSITEDDVVALNTRVMLKSPLREATYRRTRRTGIFAGAFILVALCGALMATAPTVRLGLIRAGVWAAAYAVFWPLYALRHLTRTAFEQKMVRITERLVRARRVPFSLGPVEVHVYPDRLAIVDDDGEASRPWSDAQGLTENSDAMYFEFTDGSMFRVPFRAFDSDTMKTEFADIVRDLILPRFSRPNPLH